ncbi:hypothetical protein [Salinispira pacifica]
MEHPISQFIVEYFNWVFLGILALNLFQRRQGRKAQKKRFATLYLAIGVFIIYTFSNMLLYFKLSEWFLAPFGAAVVVGAYLLRKWLFPFRLRCASCSKTLTFEQMIYRDDNLCDDCAPKPEEESAAVEQQEESVDEEPEQIVDRDDQR